MDWIANKVDFLKCCCGVLLHDVRQQLHFFVFHSLLRWQPEIYFRLKQLHRELRSNAKPL